MSTELKRIAAKASADRKLCFTALAYHITPELLVVCYARAWEVESKD